MVEYLGTIDAGTTSVRFLIFDTHGQLVNSHQKEFPQIHPPNNPNWVEHDPIVILELCKECIEKTIEAALPQYPNIVQEIKCLGIANQRETTVVWDKSTGIPLHNAIVWLDTRTDTTCKQILEKTNNNKDYFRDISGLPIASYFSGIKLKWLFDNVEEVSIKAKEGKLCFGTIDSWLIWNLTGGISGGVHVTDVTNASRTILMNLKTLDWDSSICEFLNIPLSILPKIKTSSEIYGNLTDTSLKNKPISGCLGDQQAALVGQSCLSPGQSKNTYGTGCFMLYNTGEEIISSSHGLLTTLAYQWKDQKPVYALEVKISFPVANGFNINGSIAIGGEGVRWLRDNFGIIQESKDIDDLALKVPDCGGVYFVPAFSGLFAPYWRPDARGVLVGLSHQTNKSHFARSVLESVCFQTYDVLQAMQKDSGVSLKELRVDGGMTASNLTLQTQADLLDITLLKVKPEVTETTALGGAITAGLGIGIWKDPKDIPNPIFSIKPQFQNLTSFFKKVKPEITETTALGGAIAAGLGIGIWKDPKDIPFRINQKFESKISSNEREKRLNNWKKAVDRSFNLAE